jgi:hypothetical protein
VRDGPRHGFADAVVAVSALAPLVLFLVLERHIAGAAGFPLDDSWIHLHFARNIAEGHGFSYNAGTPVAGSTAPLWTVLLGAAGAVVGPSVMLAKALGTAATMAAGILTRRAAVAWGATPALALGAGIAVVWTGALAWGALSGMEVCLAAALVAAALVAHARDRTVIVAALAALATLSRPEAVLLIPALLLARPLTPRRVAVFVVVPALALAPFVAFCLATVGTPLPATAAAKIEGGLLGWLAGVSEPVRTTFLGRPWEFLREWAVWLFTTQALLPLLVTIAMVAAWWRAGRALAVPALLLLAHPLAMALLAPYRGPAFQEGRYSMHLLPLAFVVIAAVAPRVGGRAAVAGVALYLAIGLVALSGAAVRYAWAVQNINAMQVHLGHWIDRELPRDARLAVNDIGAIAYFSRREIIDLMGLVTPAVLPYRREGERGVLRFVLERCPTHLVIFPNWFPMLAAMDTLFEERYRVTLTRNEVSGGPVMVVYRVRRCGV